MELSQIIPHIEALVFASDKPLTVIDIVELINNAFGFMEEKISMDQVDAALRGIQEKYNAEFYPFMVKQSGGGFQFLTKKNFHQTISQLNGDKFLKRLSNAALETLAIIAYKQPITKGEVEAIRGVNSDYSVQKLLEKELIIITGRNEELPGKPLVYSTTKSFMDYFGINSTDDLPKIKEVLADQSIQGTLIDDAINAHGMSEDEVTDADSNITLVVADDGQLLETTVDAVKNEEEIPTLEELTATAPENLDSHQEPDQTKAGEEKETNPDAEDLEKGTEE